MKIDRTMLAPPSNGRRFSLRRSPGLADVGPEGRVRLDALARFCQDVASADSEDSGIDPRWVVRRTTLVVSGAPVLGEHCELTTFCSGFGSRWAERRTQMRGDRGAAVEAVALWVHVDADGRPAPLEPAFHRLYGAAAAGRRVRARLCHSGPPPGVPTHRWPLRRTDLDVMGHINNAATWEAVVEEVSRLLPECRVTAAEMEHARPLDGDDRVDVCSVLDDAGFQLWLTVDGEPRVSGIVEVDPVE